MPKASVWIREPGCSLCCSSTNCIQAAHPLQLEARFDDPDWIRQQADLQQPLGSPIRLPRDADDALSMLQDSFKVRDTYNATGLSSRQEVQWR